MQFAAKLRSLLGPYKPPEKYDVVLEERIEFEDYIREQRVLTAEGVAPVPFYLLLPRSTPLKNANGKSPASLAIHGHGMSGNEGVVGRTDTPAGSVEALSAEIAGMNYDYARQLARRGYVVAAPCLTPFGRRLSLNLAERKGDNCAATFMRLQYLGKLLMAENLRDILWTLDFLAGHEEVDRERLACVGLSYGGRMTMLTTALEPRIKAAVISGAMNCMQERIEGRYSAGCQSIPGLLQYGDVPEIGSLIAPRPCVWEVGLQDKLIKAEWAEKAQARLEKAYRALGAEKQLRVDRFEGQHQWHGDAAFAMLEETFRP
jgi:dienelactone hydrolase